MPSFSNLSSGTRVRHREYLFDVITSDTPGAFTLQTIPIQPALLSSFPWLSASAENYQEYQLHGLVFEFKSNSYDALSSTNTASGTVIMATDYNVLDPPFANKFQMEQTQFTCSGKPSINLMHPIECSKLETPTSTLYTRAAPVTSGDLRLYDWGNFQIATVGMQGSSTNIGELWMTYDITLLKPKLNATVDVADHYVLPITEGIPAFAPGGPNYFGSTSEAPTLTPDSDMGTTLTSTSVANNLDTITWPVGYTGKVCVIYRSEIKSSTSATLATPYGYNFFGGCSPLPTLSSSGISTITASNEGNFPMVYNGNGGTTLVAFLDIINGGALEIGGGTNNGTPTSGDLIIIALPINFSNSLNSSLAVAERKFREYKVRAASLEVKEPTYETMDIEECHLPLTKPVLLREPALRPSSVSSNSSVHSSDSKGKQILHPTPSTSSTLSTFGFLKL